MSLRGVSARVLFYANRGPSNFRLGTMVSPSPTPLIWDVIAMFTQNHVLHMGEFFGIVLSLCRLGSLCCFPGRWSVSMHNSISNREGSVQILILFSAVFFSDACSSCPLPACSPCAITQSALGAAMFRPRTLPSVAGRL